MAINATAALQEQFSTVMLQKLKEEKGGILEKYVQKAKVTNADSYTFYRLGESTVAGDEFNMYKDNYSGNGGTVEKIKAEIKPIYTGERISWNDIKATSINLEATYVKSLSDAMRREIDKRFIIELRTKTPTSTTAQPNELNPWGDTTLELEDKANIDGLIEASVYASTLVKDMTASEGTNGVALIVTPDEFARLFKAEKITSNEYMGVAKSGTLNTMFGCEVVKVAKAVKPLVTSGRGGASNYGAIYLLPTQTVGFASWEDDISVEVWDDKQTDSLACRIKRSLGIAIIEPESIIEFAYKGK